MELDRNLRTDSVSSLQPAPPLTIQPRQPVADAVALMRQHQVGCVLVCEKGHLVGIFTERDLLRRVLGAQLPLSVPVAECMTPDPVVVEPKAPIRSAVCLMQKGGYRHLPVVDEAGRPVGVVSVKSIVHYLVEYFPAMVYNLPPDPDAVPHAPEGA